MSNLDKPAMPGLHPSKDCRYSEEGMTIRQHAAITLRVPMSGDPELDAMIREARRLDMATAAMQGLVVGRATYANEWADAAISQADALLTASEPKKAEQISMSELQSRINDRIAASDPQPDAEGWIEWHGVGDCPIDGATLVECKLRDGATDRELAGEWRWYHYGSGGDIIAYRVVKN